MKVGRWRAALVVSALAALVAGCSSGATQATPPSTSPSALLGNVGLSTELHAALAALAKNPADKRALLAAAMSYQRAGMANAGIGAPLPQQKIDVTKALDYYRRLLALPDSQLGSHASSYRESVLQSEAVIYVFLRDFKQAASTDKRALKIQPQNYDLYIQIATNDQQAGDSAGAAKAFKTFLKDDPHSPYAAQVKAALAKLKG